MPLVKSSQFTSTSASGTDWRDTAKKVLENLESVKNSDQEYTIGFLYISDVLADDVGSILTLFKSVTGIENWIGCVGIGVFSSGTIHIDKPAISAMIGCIPQKDFAAFPATEQNGTELRNNLKSFLEHTDPMLTLVHGNPLSESSNVQTLAAIENITGGFVAGGLASSRSKHMHYAGEIAEDGFSGVAFSQNITVTSFVTQGCSPISKQHLITHCAENVIKELDGQRAYDVMITNLKDMAAKLTGDSPDDIDLEKILLSDSDDPENTKLQELFRGELHVAFPVQGTDREDYMVRNAIGIDEENGCIAVAHYVANGEKMLFVQRDENTIKAELTRSLLDIRHRSENENGEFDPKGAIYISCVARAPREYDTNQNSELELIREILGEIPLAGFYANGEISNHRLYGYTGLLILFL